MKVTNILRSDLGKVRGLGAAKHGLESWIALRVTAIALIPLMLWFLASILWCINVGDYTAVKAWISNPINATLIVLMLIAGFKHMAGGVREVIEDYIHCKCAKPIMLICLKFGCIGLTVLGILSVLKIMLTA